jgi:hypothetical protein
VIRSRYFARVPDYLNVDLLRGRLVVIVGVGMVGSPIAEELARCTVGHLRFIDHDRLEEENRARHVLPAAYVGRNKADAMADYLSREVEGLTTDAVSRKIDASVPDSQIDKWLVGAHLVIAATDDRTAQRRVMQSALALDIPALAPALYVPNGGEVIFQGNWELPCFGCWDYFRSNEEQLRGARALAFIAWPVIHTTIDLSLGLLDPLSGHGEIMSEGPGRPPNQVFRLDRLGTIERARGTRRPTCPACGGGPTPPQASSQLSPPQPITSPPLASTRRPTTPANSPSIGKVIAILAVIAFCMLGIAAIASELSQAPTQPAETTPTPLPPPSSHPQPAPEHLPNKASDTFDVTPTFASAGSVSKDEYKYNSKQVERQLTLSTALDGSLLKVTVNILFEPAGVAEKNASAGIHWESSPSLAKIVSKSCVGVTTPQMIKEHNEDPESVSQLNPQEVEPFETHLQQHGLDVSGTLLYPAVLPGEYKFGCAIDGDAMDNSTLGQLSVPNLGVSEKFVVYKVRRAATDTVVLFGGWSHTEHWLSGPPAIVEGCLTPEAGGSGSTIHPSRVKLYHRWLYYKSEGYMQGALTFPVRATNIGHYRLQPLCGEEAEGIPLAASREEPTS